METIYLDASGLHSAEDVHSALKLLLGLPDYYGMNADALHDCLSERTQPPRLCVRHEADGEAAAALDKVSRVLEDLGGEMIRL
ncbi:MAG: barstar family protein [Clostridia bacterium]|nr:barstar family protein [Clostridia bacterium]